jgi:hypothetical protein
MARGQLQYLRLELGRNTNQVAPKLGVTPRQLRYALDTNTNYPLLNKLKQHIEMEKERTYLNAKDELAYLKTLFSNA